MLIIPQVEQERIKAGTQIAILQGGDERPCWPDWGPQPIRAGYRGEIIYARIVAVDQLPMGRLTEEDAHALGAASLSSLKATWNRRHRKKGTGWDVNRLVWLIRIVFDGPPATEQQSVLPL